MFQSQVITLDHIKRIQFDTGNPPLHNLHAVFYLPRGLFVLASSMREQENLVLQHYNQLLGWGPDDLNVLFAGGVPENCDHELCVCMFHWFSVSLNNYLRLIGLIDYCIQQGVTKNNLERTDVKKGIKKHADAYAEEVCPDVVRWRHKIGAHLAITSPFEKDNLGTLGMSAMSNLTHEGNRIYTSSWKWASKNQIADIPKWSVTEVFEELASRLWPTASLPTYGL